MGRIFGYRDVFDFRVEFLCETLSDLIIFISSSSFSHLPPPSHEHTTVHTHPTLSHCHLAPSTQKVAMTAVVVAKTTAAVKNQKWWQQ
jgi:hypothetical protein